MFPYWKPGEKSGNLQLKLEPEVLLAAILESEGAKSCEKNAFILRRKAIIAGVSIFGIPFLVLIVGPEVEFQNWKWLRGNLN